MPRYVLLRHECPPDFRDGPHWDLMLEDAGGLLTWSLLELPAAWSGDAAGPTNVAAERLADHRAAYLDYEGPVSGNRGTVKRVATGVCTWVAERDALVEVRATGDLAGQWTLARVDGAHWRVETSA